MPTNTKPIKDYILNLTQNNKNITTLSKKGCIELSENTASEKFQTSDAHITPLSKIETDQGHFLFKELNTEELVTEMTCSYLLRELGVDSVDMFPVVFDNKLGVLMYSYIQDKNTKAINVCKIFDDHFKNENMVNVHSSVFTIMEILQKLKKTDFIEIEYEKELVYKLTKLAIFDFMVEQEDRHSENIEFLITQNGSKKTLSMSPVFDNTYSFDMFHLMGYAKRNNIRDPQKIAEKIQKDFLVINEFNELIFTLEMPKDLLINFMKNEKTNIEKTKQKSHEITESNLSNIAKIINCNPIIREFYEKINAVEMNKIFKTIRKDTNLNIPPIMRTIISEVFRINKSILNKKVQTSKLEFDKIINSNKTLSIRNKETNHTKDEQQLD